jgi:hypothetical protein
MDEYLTINDYFDHFKDFFFVKARPPVSIETWESLLSHPDINRIENNI